MHRPFLDFCICHGYTQQVDFTTNGKNILDVILSDYDHIICNVDCQPPIGCSDHATITYTMLITVKIQHKCRSSVINRYNWYRADYTSMKLLLGQVDWQSMLVYNPSAIDFYYVFLATV